jgi:hypothetical protein
MAELILVGEKECSLEGDLRCARELEAGNILFFERVPFLFPDEEKAFLLRQRQGGSKSRKNISYKPAMDRVANHVSQDPQEMEEMRRALSNYSSRVVTLLSRILSPYSEKWRIDYTSFRPFQEKGRKLRMRARNDLLHVDAFPTRPMHGARILRFFTNINPTEGRHWVTSKPFSELALEFAGKKGLKFPRSNGYSLFDRFSRKSKKLLSSAGLKIPLRSPYDVFMLRMHNFLKENAAFQESCSKDHWEFPPGSCWAVFTDQVSHAALSGQYALEQTILVPPKALLFPDLAPVSILERLTQGNMIDPSLNPSQ